MRSHLLVGLAVLASGCVHNIAVAPGQRLHLAQQDLQKLSPAEVERRIAQDARALRHIVEGLDSLGDQAQLMHRALDADKDGFFEQNENEQIRAVLLAYLNYRKALFQMIAFHSSYQTLEDERLRLQSFLVGYGATMNLAQKGTLLVHLFRNDEVVRRKLNEPEPAWGIEAGVFDRVFANVSHPGNVSRLEWAEEEYRAALPTLAELGVLEDPRYGWIAQDAEQRVAFIKAHAPSVWDGTWEALSRTTRSVADKNSYGLVSLVATFLGDTRLPAAKRQLSPEQLDQLLATLEPGDILLTRHDFYLSNGFLPGFWPHALLYVGTPEALEKEVRPEFTSIQKYLGTYREPSRDGQPRRFIEAISEGVVFSSVEEALSAEHIAVLRPRLSTYRKWQALDRAFLHLGKRYDFEFDFFSTDRLVCTELVYRSYDESLGGERLNLELIEMMGRRTYPAVEFVRKFAKEWAEDQRRQARGEPPARELDLVQFWSDAQTKSLEDFLHTVQ